MNKDPAVDHLNRYTDILPCKEVTYLVIIVNDTRVILKQREGMSPVDTYINANYVHVRHNHEDHSVVERSWERQEVHLCAGT